jgi:hypothetical protein
MRSAFGKLSVLCIMVVLAIAGMIGYQVAADEPPTDETGEPVPHGSENEPESPVEFILSDVELPLDDSELVPEESARQTVTQVVDSRALEGAEPEIAVIELTTIGDARETYYSDLPDAPEWHFVDLNIPAYYVEIRGGPFDAGRGAKGRASAPPLPNYERLYVIVEAVEGNPIFVGTRFPIED